MKHHQPPRFASRAGFLLASVGSAVGMGNIWMFPYRLGSYGGAAFLIPYFLFVALFGAVGLSGEFALGRATGTGPVGSYRWAAESRGKKHGGAIGVIPLLGSFGIAIGYAIIVGWVLRSLAASATGQLVKSDSAEFFAAATGHFGSVPWHLAVVVLTALVLCAGVLKGIERMNKILMPAFFVLFVVLAVRVAFLPGAMEGYKYLLIPRWEALGRIDTWVMAMGQAFFSLSITGSGMIIYGSYLSKNEDIPHLSALTALLDTVAAMVSGFAIIPAVFAFGLDPTSGPPLMFITLPKVFGKMPLGSLFAALFFASVLFAGVTSLVNMFEVCAEAVTTHLHLPRKGAIALVAAIVFGAGVFLEYEPWMGSWMDFITIGVVPFGAMLGAVMIYWVLPGKTIRAQLEQGRKKALPGWFLPVAKWVYIPLTVLVFVLGLKLGGIG